MDDVSKCIDNMEFKNSVTLKKYKSEIKRLEKINNNIYLELERLQRLEEKLKAQHLEEKKQCLEEKIIVDFKGENNGDLL